MVHRSVFLSSVLERGCSVLKKTSEVLCEASHWHPSICTYKAVNLRMDRIFCHKKKEMLSIKSTYLHAAEKTEVSSKTLTNDRIVGGGG